MLRSQFPLIYVHNNYVAKYVFSLVFIVKRVVT